MLEQDSLDNLHKIAKNNYLNLIAFRNEFSIKVPLVQQYLSFKIAKEHSKELVISSKSLFLIIMIGLIICLSLSFYNLINYSDNLLLYMSFGMIFTPVVIRYLQIRKLYKESLQTYLSTLDKH